MSTIEWTGMTWNPTVGCWPVSEGCTICYAMSQAHRFKHPHYDGVTVNDPEKGVCWTGEFNVAPDHIIEKPLRVRESTLWFVNSMSDLFGEGVPDDVITRVFDIMNRTPHHTYQVLTKRPNRAVKIAPRVKWTQNIWMGVSIESDKYVGRAKLLRKIPAAIRFISAEPLLGPLPSLDLTDINWIIVGGESGKSSDKVRRMEIDWARDLRDRSVEAGVAFFFKQWGNWSANGEWSRSKKAPGRLLDGRTWDEMPAGFAAPKASSVADQAEPPKPEEPTGRVWHSVAEFRRELGREHAECPTIRIDGESPRIVFRRPIWDYLRERGPLTAADLRTHILADFALDDTKTKPVNYHAWALGDLVQRGYIESYMADVPGKRPGRTKRVKMYRATKPRVRVPARAA